MPDQMEDASKYPALVLGLIDRGYSDQDIRKIRGENLLRIMRANEPVARQMAAR
jgi:membrane dipeptidase